MKVNLWESDYWADLRCGDVLDVLATIPEKSVHCCVTSPPYFGLRAYLPAGHPDKAREIGSEADPAEYTAKMVAVFAAVKRVLRDDGTLWVNLGDGYASSSSCNRNGCESSGLKRDGRAESSRRKANRALREDMATASPPRRGGLAHGLKPKDLLMMPARVALALQAEGWYLRSQMPWVKRSAMPESVTDRPASALEYVFQFAKKPRCYYDEAAIRREGEGYGRSNWNEMQYKGGDLTRNHGGKGDHGRGGGTPTYEGGRNFRNSDLWFASVEPPHGLTGIGEELVGLDVTSVGFPGSHFACFPPKLVEPLILASTSAKGCCPTCGAPWKRVVAKERKATRPAVYTKTTGDSLTDGNRDPQRHCTTTATVGWEQGCKCNPAEPVPATVLDCFMGSGTTAIVALKHSRRFLGIDLNPTYLELARKRIWQ